MPKLQEELALNGHAFEARIYAENPRNNFLPDTGRLVHLKTPQEVDCILRVETGVRQGDEVSVYYDPMIAKLVVWAEDRTAALRRLRKALGEYQVVGPSTNIEFLKALASHPEFIEGHVETGFIKKHYDELFPILGVESTSVVQAAMAIMMQEKREVIQRTDKSNPWSFLDDYRMNFGAQRHFVFLVDSEKEGVDKKEVRVSGMLNREGGYDFTVENGKQVDEFKNVRASFNASAGEDDHSISVEFQDRLYQSQVVLNKNSVYLFSQGKEIVLDLPEQAHYVPGAASLSHAASASSQIKAPMPSKIAQVMIKPGQKVKKGQTLLILEAMKMEHVMRAPMDGVVKRVGSEVGELVGDGQVLVVFEDSAEKKEE